MTAPRRFEIVVSDADAGERFDRACAAVLAPHGISRNAIANACAHGLASVNSKAARASTRVHAGDRIVVEIAPDQPLSAEPQAIPLRVLFEDADLLVIDKPAGLVVHPARGHASGTLVNAVLHHTAVQDADADPLRPGIVHRLDKGTSGVLVIAKTAAAREGLKSQFQAHTIERSYLAITEGVPPAGVTYDTMHGRHRTDRKRFTSHVEVGRRAVTRLVRVEALAGGRAALVRCVLETGRTHQIRMHLSEHGFPILGDPLYGRRPGDSRLREAVASLTHQALHAAVLGFSHPRSGQPMRFESDPPPDFETVLTRLRGL